MSLETRAWLALVALAVVMALLLFVSAGSVRYWQAWVYLSIFFGAAALSFGEGIELSDGDVMQISFAGFGRPLRNPVQITRSEETLVRAYPL